MSPEEGKPPADLQKKESDDSWFVTEALTKMNPWVHRLLAAWFVVLGLAAIWFLFDLWPPGQATPSRSASQDTTVTAKAPASSSTQKDSLSTGQKDSPSAGIYRRWRKSLNADQVFFLIAFWAGILGGAAHGLSSLMDFRGNRRLFRSWTLWYFGQPILGGMMAVVFYITMRAGLVSNSVDANVLSPFGVGAVSALVGLFTDAATTKLAEVFKTLFASTGKPRGGQLNPDAPSTKEQRGAKRG